MKRKFIIHALLFFTPVMLIFGVLEYLTRQLPSTYRVISEYIETDASEIETLVLGPSQIMQAVNPKLMSTPTLSLASGSQHHDTDFQILKQIRPRLPQLQTVILELSYSHLELPHNGRYFWKNSVYFKYYGVNNFDRNTYFKDQLILLSRPSFFSEKLIDYYIHGNNPTQFNRFGFDENNYAGLFRQLKYNRQAIENQKRFKINKEPNRELFAYNSAYLISMLDYLKEEQLDVVICTIPMYATYLKQRHPEILHRRDSLLQVIQKSYSNVRILHKENDTVNFDAKDFINPSHMNPDGAAKFTPMLVEFMQGAN